MKPTTTTSTQVVAFCSAVAQPDNLGDVIIRDQMIGWLASSCDRVHVLAEGLPPDFVSAFDHPPEVEFVPSRLSFGLLVLRALVSRHTPVLAFAPGPVSLRGRARDLARGAANLASALVVRLGGGLVVSVGRAVRGDSLLARAVERTIARVQHLYVARDAVTRDILGDRVVVAPDLAFALEPRPPAGGPVRERNLVLSFRGDRGVDVAHLRRWADVARSTGLRPVVCTQVRRDDEQHRRLARELGADLVAWPHDVGHAAQLERVREVMANADVVVGNRLHALILGAVHGAAVVPVPLPGSDKLEATLSVVPSTAARVADEGGPGGAVLLDMGDARQRAGEVGVRIAEVVGARRTRRQR